MTNAGLPFALQSIVHVRNLIRLLLVILLVSVSAIVVLDRKPLCIDSMLVEKIDRISVEGTAVAFQCAVRKSVPYDEKLSLELPALSRRLLDLDQLFDEVSPLQNKIEIIWLDGMKKTMRIQQHKIFISGDLLLHSDQLERGLLREWLREKAMGVNLDKTILEGSLIDLILYSLGKSQTPDYSQERWPTLLRSAETYCQQADADKDFTLNSNAICPPSPGDGHKILVESARSLVAESMKNVFYDLGIREGSRFLRTLPSFLAHIQKFQMPPFLNEDVVVADPEAIHWDISNLLHLVNEYAQRDGTEESGIWKEFAAGLKQEFERRGFSQTMTAAQLDHLIMVGSDVPLDEKAVQEFRKYPITNQLVALADQQNIWMLPGDMPLEKKVFSFLKVHQLLYVSCTLPTPGLLLEFSRVAEKLLYVHSCQSLASLNLRSYLAQGVEGFASDNPKLSFIQIHLPSFLQAWKNHGQNPLPALAHQDWKDPFFRNAGWRPPVWDDNLKMFRSQSVIQAIEAYRPVN